MPATAGRVRMPANNRVHSSAALQTHGIWQSAIGYDPYAPTNKDDNKKSAQAVSAAEPEGENAYASFQGLLALAKITNSNSDEARGACTKCGRVGHLKFQCRNFLSFKDDLNKGVKDDDAIREVMLDKLKGERVKLNGIKKDKAESGESSEEEEEESESSDSDYDSEIERIIAEKFGKKSDGKGKLSSSKEEEDDEEEKGERRKKRGRSKKRRSRKRESSDSEDEDEGGKRRRRKKRKEKRIRRDDDSSDDGEEQRRKRKSRQEKRRRRSHRHSSEDSKDSSEDSPERRRKRRSRRVSSPSDSDVSASDDSRVGRDKRRVEKNSRKRHREKEN